MEIMLNLFAWILVAVVILMTMAIGWLASLPLRNATVVDNL